MTDRDKLIAKIRALTAKTVEAGCTEAEALLAAEKAAALMRDYQISHSELFMEQHSVRRRTAGQSQRDRLWRALAINTNTASILDFNAQGQPQRTFVGHEPGPQIAVYLYVVLDRAIDRAVAEFKSGGYYSRRRSLKTKRLAVAEFTHAMVCRLRDRLWDLFASSRSESATAAALNALTERFPDAVEVAPRKQQKGKVTVTPASISGFMAGEAVPLSHGMRGASEPARLTGKVGA